MTIEEIFKVAAAIIASLGGGALIIAACANWLAGIWAKRMLQSERAKHAEKLENIKTELDLIKQKNLTRHFDKLSAYKDVVRFVSEILRELEAVVLERRQEINPEIKRLFALNRNTAYGLISLVSTQAVMDKYNHLIDFFIPIIYEGDEGSWIEMRTKADALLNEMRRDIGITDEEVFYRGER